MNMQNLMMQAKKLQSEMQNIQAQLEKTIYQGENQGVKININGKLIVESIEIDNKELLNDIELLQDVVMIATNDALEKVKKDKKEKLGKYSGGMEGLF